VPKWKAKGFQGAAIGRAPRLSHTQKIVVRIGLGSEKEQHINSCWLIGVHQLKYSSRLFSNDAPIEGIPRIKLVGNASVFVFLTFFQEVRIVIAEQKQGGDRKRLGDLPQGAGSYANGCEQIYRTWT
jgi:hypothetical protein